MNKAQCDIHNMLQQRTALFQSTEHFTKSYLRIRLYSILYIVLSIDELIMGYLIYNMSTEQVHADNQRHVQIFPQDLVTCKCISGEFVLERSQCFTNTSIYLHSHEKLACRVLFQFKIPFEPVRFWPVDNIFAGGTDEIFSFYFSSKYQVQMDFFCMNVLLYYVFCQKI